jgi:hypothetical protein
MDWVREVLTLPGISSDDKDLIRRTGAAVHARDRTRDGYYGGCWDGPADGPNSAWGNKEHYPQQLMTSVSAVELIVAAAFEQ